MHRQTHRQSRLSTFRVSIHFAALPTEVLSIKPWQPPGIDEIKVSTAAGVVCPSAQVIEESGKRVQELVHDVERFAAVEDLFHQTLDSYGIPVRSETRKYNYVASISEPQPGVLNVDEYRAEKMTLPGLSRSDRQPGICGTGAGVPP